MERGYVRLYRKVLDSGLIQLPKTYALFCYILLNATHRARKVGTSAGVIHLQPGQFISGRARLSAILNQTENEVRTSVLRLKRMEIIHHETTNKFSVFTLINWAKYQTPDAQTTINFTTNPPSDHHQTTTKQEVKHLSISSLSGDKSPGFSEFWNLYPKKRGKGDAQILWQRKKLNSQAAAIIAALQNNINSRRWRKEDGKWIPYPAKWLRQEAWHDQEAVDLPPPKKAEGNKTVSVHDPAALAALQDEADRANAEGKTRYKFK